MLGLLTTCFSFSKSTKTPEQLLPAHTRTNLSDSCVFCHVSSENGFVVLWENNDFIAFQDHSPAARYHFQVIPKTHIASVKELRKTDVNLVRKMDEIGHKLLDDHEVPSITRRLGFHIPPYNSVNHLHLHVLGLPFRSFERSVKYPTINGGGTYHKGFSWFAEVGQTINILESGGRVGVWPC